MRNLFLDSQLRAQIEMAARDAYPRECCGLIEGFHDGSIPRATRVHAMENLASERDRFEIDPMDQFRIVREARVRGRGVIGCYHSHPNGTCELSMLDRDCAGPDGFVWLIAAINGRGNVQLAAFIVRGDSFERMTISDERAPRQGEPVACVADAIRSA